MAALNKARFILLEKITTFLWFALDGSWLFEQIWLANTLSALVTVTALVALWFAEAEDRGVAISIFLWVLMSAFWVTGDVNKLPQLILIAKALMVCTLICLSIALAKGSVSRVRL